MLKTSRNFFSKTHYEVLSVSPQASLEEIKKAFRLIVKEIHPDIRKNNKDMSSEFKKVVEAY
jgi:curved DNA-binding protein CbpA